MNLVKIGARVTGLETRIRLEGEEGRQFWALLQSFSPRTWQALTPIESRERKTP